LESGDSSRDLSRKLNIPPRTISGILKYCREHPEEVS
jgi:hypothetical protein